MGRAAMNLAWLRAVSGRTELRDPEEAVLLAELALETTPPDWSVFDTLGAAYAAAERFAEAEEAARAAEELALTVHEGPTYKRGRSR